MLEIRGWRECKDFRSSERCQLLATVNCPGLFVDRVLRSLTDITPRTPTTPLQPIGITEGRIHPDPVRPRSCDVRPTPSRAAGAALDRLAKVRHNLCRSPHLWVLPVPQRLCPQPRVWSPADQADLFSATAPPVSDESDLAAGQPLRRS